MMHPSFWLDKWLNNDIGFNQQDANKLLQRYIDHLNLKTGSRILVPLCGKSIDMLWLLQQGYRVLGVELSQMACEQFFLDYGISFKKHAQDDFIRYEHEDITLLAGDFFSLTQEITGDFSAIYDRAALVALPQEMRQRYAQTILNLTKPNTKMLLIATAYDQSTMNGPPFSVDEQEVTSLYGNTSHIEILYHQPLKTIPKHLAVKGLSFAYEQAYKISLHALKNQ